MEGSTTSNPNPQPPVLLGKKARMRGPNNNKPKITKEERRLKYTAKARDRREAAQARSRDRDLTCYRCRKSGHSAENCKFAPADAATTAADYGGGGGEGGGGEGGATSWSVATPTPTPPPGRKRKKGGNICYKCGSTEHRIQLCPRIKPFLQKGNGSRIDYGKIGDLPFAECYVCNGTGHLASHCPSSDKGLYPRGGSCRVCGSVDHLAADCSNEREGGGKGGMGRPSDDNDDDDDDDAKSVASSNSITIDRYLEETADAEEEKTTTSSKKKRRIVKF